MGNTGRAGASGICVQGQACTLTWPAVLAGLPDLGHTCHDVLHHRDEVGRLAEGGRIVILILERKCTGFRNQGGSLDWSLQGGWTRLAPRSSADLCVMEPGGVSRGNQVTHQLGYSSQWQDRPWRDLWESRTDGDGQSDGE